MTTCETLLHRKNTYFQKLVKIIIKTANSKTQTICKKKKKKNQTILITKITHFYLSIILPLFWVDEGTQVRNGTDFSICLFHFNFKHGEKSVWETPITHLC